MMLVWYTVNPWPTRRSTESRNCERQPLLLASSHLSCRKRQWVSPSQKNGLPSACSRRRPSAEGRRKPCECISRAEAAGTHSTSPLMSSSPGSPVCLVAQKFHVPRLGGATRTRQVRPPSQKVGRSRVCP